MAKIGIFEDNVYDVIRRYRGLVNQGHEVHVCIFDPVPLVSKEEIETLFKERNFNPHSLYMELLEMPTNADIYFCDGLRRGCFSVAKRFGKEKTIINTGDLELHGQAKQEGYRVLETSMENIIKSSCFQSQ